MTCWSQLKINNIKTFWKKNPPGSCQWRWPLRSVGSVLSWVQISSWIFHCSDMICVLSLSTCYLSFFPTFIPPFLPSIFTLFHPNLFTSFLPNYFTSISFQSYCFSFFPSFFFFTSVSSQLHYLSFFWTSLLQILPNLIISVSSQSFYPISSQPFYPVSSQP